MYDGVRDARVKATAYIDVICNFIPTEDDNQVIDVAYTYVAAATSILTRANNAEYLSKLYAVTRTKLIGAKDSQFIISLIQKLVTYGFSEADVKDLKEWLEGSGDLKDFKLTNDLKWKITCKVCGSSSFTDEEKDAAFNKRFEEDQSDVRKKYKLKVDALRADDAQREALFEGYFSDGEAGMNYEDLSYSIGGFTSRYITEERQKPFFDKYFTKIVTAMTNKSKSIGRVRIYFLTLDPFQRTAPRHRLHRVEEGRA